MKVKYFYDDLNESLKNNYSMELPAFPIFLFEFYDLMNYSSLTCDIDVMNSENIGPSFDDLLASNQCKLLLLLLLDVQTYWKYENREFLIANQVNDPNQGSNAGSSSSSSSSTSHTPSQQPNSNNASASPPSPQEKASLYDAHMTNYHYYADDNYDEDSFYSDEGNNTPKTPSSSKDKNGLTNEDDEEVDQVSAMDQKMKSKYQQYSKGNSNRSTIEEMKKSLNFNDILKQNADSEPDYYDF